LKDNSIIFLGDIAFNGILSTEYEKNHERFLEVIPILSESDFVFANLEVPIKVDDSQNEYKNFIHFSIQKPTSELLKLLNIGCVSLANNHIYDCKMSGLKATIKLLDELGIKHTGAGWKNEHIEPVEVEMEGKRIGFMAYVDGSTNPKTEFFPELLINYFNTEKVIKDINKYRSRFDRLIVSIHWGVDYSHFQTKEQVKIARSLIDKGVDIIMGHHPHTLQPYEKYKDGHIFYSLGGLTFGDFIRAEKSEIQALYRKTKWGLISRLNIDTDSFSFISTREQKGNYIKISSKDYIKWSNYHWKIFYWKNNYSLINKIMEFKENFFDRVFEYFFGYYQNPIKRLFQFSNIRKIKKLIN
jgi:poly-gamma-glutamate capsule biosynthesis protein CapA/YwtB (metallophosphatase superfamily)